MWTTKSICKGFLTTWLKITIWMRYRRLTSIITQFQWVLYMLQTPLCSCNLKISIFDDKRARFHGIPWNCSCQRNWHIPSSMEFHGTARVVEIGATLSPMEFHGISWNCSCHRNWRNPSSIEFHEIPRNCSCQRNWPTQSSMESLQWRHNDHDSVSNHQPHGCLLNRLFGRR